MTNARTERSRRPEIVVEVDSSGWLRAGIEIHFTLGPGRILQPAMLRVARDAAIDELVANGGVIASVARYNRALGALHDLRARFAAFVERQHTALEPGSEIWAVGRVLSKLEADIASRQSMRMGSNVVGLQTLEAEIGFLERYHAYLAAVTRRAEKIERASACNDGTLDLDPED